MLQVPNVYEFLEGLSPLPHYAAAVGASNEVVSPAPIALETLVGEIDALALEYRFREFQFLQHRSAQEDRLSVLLVQPF